MEALIGYIQQGFSYVVPFIILLGLLIFVHELGHFLVAKYFGVRVEVFSLGFGKKIFQYKISCKQAAPIDACIKFREAWKFFSIVHIGYSCSCR